MIDGKYILDAILSSMTNDEKVSLLAKLTTEVGNLQPDDVTLAPGTEPEHADFANPGNGHIPERSIKGERITITLPEQPVLDEVTDAEEPVTGEVEFVMVRSKKPIKKSASKPSVGDNLFTDDEGLHKGDDYTPPEKPKEPRQRRDPPKKVEQICKRCDDAVMVHEIEARDWFICGKCIKKGKTE